jgi:hypothetical protein
MSNGIADAQYKNWWSDDINSDASGAVVTAAGPAPVTASALVAPTQRSALDFIMEKLKAIYALMRDSDAKLLAARDALARMMETALAANDEQASAALTALILRQGTLARAQAKINAWYGQMLESLGFTQSESGGMGFAFLIPVAVAGTAAALTLGAYYAGTLRREVIAHNKEVSLKEKAYSDAVSGKTPWSVFATLGTGGEDWKSLLVKALPFVAIGGGGFYLLKTLQSR